MKSVQHILVVLTLLIIACMPVALAEDFEHHDDLTEDDVLDVIDEVKDLQEDYLEESSEYDCELSEAEDWYDYSEEYLEDAFSALDEEDYHKAMEAAEGAIYKIKNAFGAIDCDEYEKHEDDHAEKKTDIYGDLGDIEEELDEVRRELEEHEAEGCDVESAWDYYESAKKQFTFAEQDFIEERYEAAIESIEDAEHYLDKIDVYCEELEDINLEMYEEAMKFLEEVKMELSFAEKEACDITEAESLLDDAYDHLEKAKMDIKGGSDGEYLSEEALEFAHRALESILCEDTDFAFENEEFIDELRDEIQALKDALDEEEEFIEETEEEVEEFSCETGCLVEDRCVPVGYRQVEGDAQVFCSGDGELVSQREDGATCQNDFECLSNSCSSSSCYDVKKEIEENRSLLNKLLGWFGRFFGGN